jgi:hypothetical protein
VAALDHIDRALRVLGDDPGHADLRSFAQDGCIFTLQNLDRWPQAEVTLRRAREASQRSGNPDRATWVTAAVLRYWLGEWDDALAELGPDDADAPGLTHSFLRERWSALLLHGVSALIAGRRDERTAADQQLRQGLALPIQTLADRENQDFLVAAHALALEQSGETHQAMLRLAAMLPRRDGEMTLIHQWLPDLVRLALAAGDRPMAQAATRACQAEAAAETHPARATVASLRCRGLLESDPDPLTEAVAHYRALGPGGTARRAEDSVVLARAAGKRGARTALPRRSALLGACRPAGTSASRGYPSLGVSRGGRGQRGPAGGFRLAGAHPDRGQDRRHGGQGRVDLGHCQEHVLVPADRPDLYLAHPRQARREGPGGHRPRGAAPVSLALGFTPAFGRRVTAAARFIVR